MKIFNIKLLILNKLLTNTSIIISIRNMLISRTNLARNKPVLIKHSTSQIVKLERYEDF